MPITCADCCKTGAVNGYYGNHGNFSSHENGISGDIFHWIICINNSRYGI